MSKDGERFFGLERLARVLSRPHSFLTRGPPHVVGGRGGGSAALGGSSLWGLETCCGRTHSPTPIPTRAGESCMGGLSLWQVVSFCRDCASRVGWGGSAVGKALTWSLEDLARF